jgi:DNA-binding CsgD family transcriptional regulator
MANGPPNKAQIIERERTAWKLRCQGWTLQRIADHLGLSASGIWRALRRIEKRELRNLSEHYQGLKAQVAAQLDYIVSQCSESWDKSKEPRRRATQKASDGEEVTTSDIIEQCGDVRYLETWMKAASMKMSLFGLHVQPAENEVNFTITELVADMKRREEEYESGESARKAWGEQHAAEIVEARKAAKAAREGAAGLERPDGQAPGVPGASPDRPRVAPDGVSRGPAEGGVPGGGATAAMGLRAD